MCPAIPERRQGTQLCHSKEAGARLSSGLSKKACLEPAPPAWPKGSGDQFGIPKPSPQSGVTSHGARRLPGAAR